MSMRKCDGNDCNRAVDCYFYHSWLSEPIKNDEPDADWRVFSDEHKALMWCRDFKRYREPEILERKK